MRANFIRIKNSSSFLFFYKKERKRSAFQLYRHYWIFIGISLHFSGTFLCTAAVLDMKTKNDDDLPFDSIIVVIIIKMSSQSRVSAANCTTLSGTTEAWRDRGVHSSPSSPPEFTGIEKKRKQKETINVFLLTFPACF